MLVDCGRSLHDYTVQVNETGSGYLDCPDPQFRTELWLELHLGNASFKSVALFSEVTGLVSIVVSEPIGWLLVHWKCPSLFDQSTYIAEPWFLQLVQ